MIYKLFSGLLLTVIILATTSPSLAAEIRVAVASNFSETLAIVAKNFERDTGHRVKLIVGSTGKHYAQIKHGAPFDAFFAADIKRPAQLEKEHLSVMGSRFTYAIGKLVLWSPMANYIDNEINILKQNRFRHLAIANPRLAPYGVAAQQVLESYDLWDSLKHKTVRGENIGQAFQFVSSGNAELGFIAYSQIKRPGHMITGSWWLIPETLYTPIAQQAVLLKDKAVAHQFMSYVKGDKSLAIIHSFGYGTP
ncbi:MAG: molybdate ABC transporter substrate-binding protein [Gammaproteobacteria bacterium]|nr:molybdate ABC transporter substrate-binding protein [Gammaproteobacteria bacterium]